MPTDEDSEEQNSINVASKRTGKCYNNDLSGFKSNIKELTTNPDTIANLGDNLFNKAEVGKIIEYIFRCYFNQYDLFEYYVKHPQIQEDM